MENKNPHGVKVGQVWAGCDPRYPDVHLKVVQVREDLGYAQVVVMKNNAFRRIKLTRFIPRTNGYKLLRDSKS